MLRHVLAEHESGHALFEGLRDLRVNLVHAGGQRDPRQLRLRLILGGSGQGGCGQRQRGKGGGKEFHAAIVRPKRNCPREAGKVPAQGGQV
ncbi:hypothetical protein GCM10027034_03810 [Ramlibacter solisilvae]